MGNAYSTRRRARKSLSSLIDISEEWCSYYGKISGQLVAAADVLDDMGRSPDSKNGTTPSAFADLFYNRPQVKKLHELVEKGEAVSKRLTDAIETVQTDVTSLSEFNKHLATEIAEAVNMFSTQIVQTISAINDADGSASYGSWWAAAAKIATAAYRVLFNAANSIATLQKNPVVSMASVALPAFGSSFATALSAILTMAPYVSQVVAWCSSASRDNTAEASQHLRTVSQQVNKQLEHVEQLRSGLKELHKSMKSSCC